MVGGLQAAASLGWDQELWDNELAAAAAEGGQAAPEEPAEEQREEEDDELVEVAGAFDKEWTELSKSGPTSQTPPMSHLRKTDWLCTGLVCREEERRSLGLHCRQLVRQRPAEACALGLALQGLAEVREEARLGRGAVGQRARDGDQGRSLSNVFQCRGAALAIHIRVWMNTHRGPATRAMVLIIKSTSGNSDSNIITM